MVAWWLVLLTLAVSWSSIDACSCALEHPQMTYCNSDFAIVARVVRVRRVNSYLNEYRLKIQNYFKASAKAMVALKRRRIYTSASNSMCGVYLKPRETYAITGHVGHHLQAHVNLCGYVKPWREVCPRFRKGFRLLFNQGCGCKVRQSQRPSKTPNTCVTYNEDCYNQYGICLQDNRKGCRWTRAPSLTRCLMKHNATRLL